MTSAYRRDGASDFNFANWGATARVLRRFDDAGHEWSNELRYDKNSNDSSGLAVTDYLIPAGPALYERTANATDQVNWGFTSAYTRPLSTGGKLRLGYELNDQRPEQRTRLPARPVRGGGGPGSGPEQSVRGAPDRPRPLHHL